MRYLDQSWTRIFLAPETGGGSGAAAPNPDPQQQQSGGGSSTAFVDPTANLDLDDLEPEVRKIVEESKKGFATLQKQVADTEAARLHEENRRKDFQSNLDQLKAQMQKITGAVGGQQTGADPRAQQLEKMAAILVKRGVAPANAATQAELMLDMMTEWGSAFKAEIGTDLRPFANSVVAREADFAWNTSMQSDKTGAMTIPTVAQTAWTQVQTMVEHGQQVTPGVVQNLVAMAYFAHLQNGGAAANQQQTVTPQQQQQLPNVGRLTYPGAGASASRPQINDPGAARTTLDPDTDAALQVVFGKWAQGNGQKAPGYREPAKKGGR